MNHGINGLTLLAVLLAVATILALVSPLALGVLAIAVIAGGAIYLNLVAKPRLRREAALNARREAPDRPAVHQ
jgi:NADH:ubiquinone oxidoreductase subunit 6 (subunit J)